MPTLYGGIEAGGTKFNCAVGSGPGELAAEVRLPTTSPAETLAAALDFFRTQQARLGPLAAIGAASFGPIDLQPGSPTYGFITSTPKPGWKNTDIVGPLAREFGAPVGFDTDVNAAALSEGLWGAGQGLNDLVYITVGTGIGGGGLANGRPIHGLLHPEMGHMLLPHNRQADPFAGSCPYHGDCFEGLANGPAMAQRWGQPAESLPPDHPAWPLEAHYLALGLANIILTLSPQRIVLGGGVMEQRQLFPLIRAEVARLLNGYIQSAWIHERSDEYIVPPGLGSRAGVLGAIALAQAAAENQGPGVQAR
jgi:fructokinase